MIQPVVAGAVGGLLMENLAALFPLPSLYVLFNRTRTGKSAKDEV